jgi:ribosomal protein L35
MEFDEKFKECPCNKSVQVSQYGRVRSTDTGKILEQTVYKDHCFVRNPRKEEKDDKKNEWVHRLVALTWLKDTYEEGKGLRVHHKNLNGLDNRVDNLVWVTEEEHASAHGIPVEDGYCLPPLEYTFSELCELHAAAGTHNGA